MSGQEFWTLSEADGIGTLTLDVPERPVNVLSGPVLDELSALLTEAKGSGLKGLVVASAKSGFIAGADISEIADLTDPTRATALVSRGQEVFLQLERLPFPTVAAIHGVCLGGGLELALACSERICTDDDSTRMGLPEVKLGIHPGFGGCVRLPQVIGLARAVPWILAGRTVGPREAKKARLVSEVVAPETLLAAAAKRARSARRSGPPGGGLMGFLLTGNPLGRQVFFRKAEQQLEKKLNRDHYPAPFAALEVMQAIHGKGSDEAHRIEAASCGGLIPERVTKNLIRVFFASEAMKHQEAARLGKADAAAIRQVAVVGGGIMGAGIAGEMARKGMVVRFADLSPEALGKGMATIAKSVKRATRNARRGEAERVMQRLLPTTDLGRLGRADLLVEAVPEVMDIKRDLMARALPQLGEGALLATNTSSLSVTQMFEEVPEPGRGCGMHFFNPVPRMPLVEVVVGEKSHPATIATVTALAVRMGKFPLVVQDCPGFLVNRILMPYLNEALLLLEEGADIDGVDRVLKDFGMPMGAFRLIDEIGMDVCHHVSGVLQAGYGDRMTPAASMQTLYTAGRYGRKGGGGFYRYEDGKESGVDEAVYALLSGRGSHGPGDDEIRDRCILAMVAEAGRILHEDIVESPQMLDAGMVFGTGFPAFRGGLMRYVEERGVGQVLALLEGFSERHGERFAANDWLRGFGVE